MGQTSDGHTMISRILLTAAFIGLGSIANVAHADWTRSQRSQFMEDCVPACEKNPRVASSYKNRCRNYCQCYIDESEAVFPDYAVLEKEVADNPESDLVRRFKNVAPTCNRRVFGS